jgi:hypothetical protein
VEEAIREKDVDQELPGLDRDEASGLVARGAGRDHGAVGEGDRIAGDEDIAGAARFLAAHVAPAARARRDAGILHLDRVGEDPHEAGIAGPEVSELIRAPAVMRRSVATMSISPAAPVAPGSAADSIVELSSDRSRALMNTPPALPLNAVLALISAFPVSAMRSPKMRIFPPLPQTSTKQKFWAWISEPSLSAMSRAMTRTSPAFSAPAVRELMKEPRMASVSASTLSRPAAPPASPREKVPITLDCMSIARPGQ